MCICRRESSLWSSLVLGGFPNKLQAHGEERVLEWIQLNREENIDGPITGESGEAWRDGGRPKLRSISEAGGREKKHQNTDALGGVCVTPQNRCDDLWVEKTKHTLHPGSKTRDCTLFSLFSSSAFLSVSLSHRRSLHAFHRPAHEPPEAESSESSSPLSTYTREDRTTVIHCYFGLRAPWSKSGRGHIGIFCGSRGCFQSQITPPDR